MPKSEGPKRVGKLACSGFGHSGLFRHLLFVICHPRRAGWTAIEMIAVLAVMAILAAMLLPPFIRRIDRAAWEKETAELNTIADSFTQ